MKIYELFSVYVTRYREKMNDPFKMGHFIVSRIETHKKKKKKVSMFTNWIEKSEKKIFDKQSNGKKTRSTFWDIVSCGPSNHSRSKNHMIRLVQHICDSVGM